ncbi:putative ribonuclease H-like domain-containing protein [Tanacetum coccineum]
MAISSSSSSSSSDSEVQKCSKQCLESFKTLQKNYDTEREKHNKAKLEIRGYEIALESLESRILRHEKNELAWGEKYEFQNYELKCREIKINNLNLELEKVVKERDELKDKIAKWEESTKNLDGILNSQMSARDKTSLGYSTQLNDLSSNHETDSENSLSIFDVRSSDEENTPENDRFSKNGYKAVPPPIIENFLTPRADISFAGLDEYAIMNKIIESQTTELNTKTSVDLRDRVIIEDWNSDDEEEEYEVQTVRPESQTVKPRVDKIGVLTRTGLHRPSVSTARPVCTARPSVSTARPVCTARPSVSTVRPVSTAKSSVSTARPVYATRPIYLRMDNVRPRGSCLLIKRVQNMTTVETRAVVNTGKGQSRDLVAGSCSEDSGCCSHMNGNKAYRSGYEDFNGGFVAFGSDPKGYKINGTEFKNYAMNEFCAKKGIKRGFSVARTPQQNGVAERKNRTLIEAAFKKGKPMVLVTKPQNKTPYELLIGKSPSISFMRPFGCPLTILNTLDSLGKFDGKSDEGYLLGYSTSSKAFRVYNKRTKRVEENLHINFLEDQPNVNGEAGRGQNQRPEDEQVLHDELEKMVTQELTAKAMDDVSRQAFEEENSRIASQKKAAQATSTNKLSTDRQSVSTDRPSVSTDRPSVSTDRPFVSTDRSNTPYVSAASTSTGANAGESSFVYLGGKIPIDASTLPNADLPIDPNMLDLEDASDTLPNYGIFNGAYDDDEDVGDMA